jgi:hypothetical protein
LHLQQLQAHPNKLLGALSMNDTINNLSMRDAQLLMTVPDKLSR